MVEEVLVSGVGHFIISDLYSDVVGSLLKENVKIGRTTLKYRQETDLDGYFNKEKVFYAGYKQKSATKILYFYYGSESELFGDKHYFQTIHLITKNRIYIGFHNNGGRDFNFINGKWDWERKSIKIKSCENGTEPKEEK